MIVTILSFLHDITLTITHHVTFTSIRLRYQTGKNAIMRYHSKIRFYNRSLSFRYKPTPPGSHAHFLARLTRTRLNTWRALVFCHGKRVQIYRRMFDVANRHAYINQLATFYSGTPAKNPVKRFNDRPATTCRI